MLGLFLLTLLFTFGPLNTISSLLLLLLETALSSRLTFALLCENQNTQMIVMTTPKCHQRCTCTYPICVELITTFLVVVVHFFCVFYFQGNFLLILFPSNSCEMIAEITIRLENVQLTVLKCFASPCKLLIFPSVEGKIPPQW